MTEGQIRAADAIVAHLKGVEGRSIVFKNIEPLQFEGIKLADLRYALSLLKKRDIVTFNEGIIHGAASFYLSETGWLYESFNKLIEEDLEKNKQEELKKRLEIEHIESSLSTNKSVQHTNQSVQDTNTFQRYFSKWSLWLAGISTAFILVTIIQSILDKTPQQLQDIETQLKNQSQELKNTRISLEKINSSIRRVADSLPHK